MNVKLVLIVNAVFDLLAGIALVLIPGLATSLLGLQIGPVGLGLARLLGCALITLGMLSYRMRDMKDPLVIRALLLSLFTGTLIATLLALVGQVFMLLDTALVSLVESKISPVLKGGLPVSIVLVILLIMTISYAYLLFTGKAPARQPKASRIPG